MKLLQIILTACLIQAAALQAQTILPASATKISPQELAHKIQNNEAQQWIIINTGPVNDIAGAINIGAVEQKKNVKKLRRFLKKIPRHTPIVYYCGCCPFATCPNLLPAAKLLQDMKFTNYRALDLPKSLKLDWIEKGYPMPAQ